MAAKIMSRVRSSRFLRTPRSGLTTKTIKMGEIHEKPLDRIEQHLRAIQKLCYDPSIDRIGIYENASVALEIVRGCCGPTARQKEALDFIVRFSSENHMMPTYEEIKKALGLASKSGVHRIISELEERGLIRRSPSAGGRSLKIIGQTEHRQAEKLARAGPNRYIP